MNTPRRWIVTWGQFRLGPNGFTSGYHYLLYQHEVDAAEAAIMKRHATGYDETYPIEFRLITPTEWRQWLAAKGGRTVSQKQREHLAWHNRQPRPRNPRK